MREIKFRGVDLERNQWVYGDLLTVAIPLMQHVPAIIDKDGIWPCDPKSIGQRVGLVGKDGGVVHEGDISLSFGVCFWNEEYQAFNWRDLENGDEHEFDYLTCEIVVAGNKRDNPELLEDQNNG